MSKHQAIATGCCWGRLDPHRDQLKELRMSETNLGTETQSLGFQRHLFFFFCVSIFHWKNCHFVSFCSLFRCSNNDRLTICSWKPGDTKTSIVEEKGSVLSGLPPPCVEELILRTSGVLKTKDGATEQFFHRFPFQKKWGQDSVTTENFAKHEWFVPKAS